MAPKTTPTTAKSRVLVGTVISTKMAKTVVVRVDRITQHPKYERRYRVSKKYKAHDEANACREGDRVRIAETRPLSADKRWVVVERIVRAADPTAGSESAE